MRYTHPSRKSLFVAAAAAGGNILCGGKEASYLVCVAITFFLFLTVTAPLAGLAKAPMPALAGGGVLLGARSATFALQRSKGRIGWSGKCCQGKVAQLCRSRGCGWVHVPLGRRLCSILAFRFRLGWAGGGAEEGGVSGQQSSAEPSWAIPLVLPGKNVHEASKDWSRQYR